MSRKEKWKKLKQDKNYLISNWGRIFSLKTEKFIRPYVHQSRSNKYLRVQLSGVKYMLHVLVAYNFKFREYEELKELYPDEKIQVGHDDRNTLNPASYNLTFETESQNKAHMHKTSFVTFGGKTYKGKLSEQTN